MHTEIKTIKQVGKAILFNLLIYHSKKELWIFTMQYPDIKKKRALPKLPPIAKKYNGYICRQWLFVIKIHAITFNKVIKFLLFVCIQ